MPRDPTNTPSQARRSSPSSVPEGDFPVAPSWCLTDKELIVALFPQNVKAYLVAGAGFPVAGRGPRGGGTAGVCSPARWSSATRTRRSCSGSSTRSCRLA